MASSILCRKKSLFSSLYFRHFFFLFIIGLVYKICGRFFKPKTSISHKKRKKERNKSQQESTFIITEMILLNRKFFHMYNIVGKILVLPDHYIVLHSTSQEYANNVTTLYYILFNILFPQFLFKESIIQQQQKEEFYFF